MMMTSTENSPIKVFVDTNVIIDALTLRDYEYKPSKALLYNITEGRIKGYICSKQITDNIIFSANITAKKAISENVLKK